MCHILRRAYHSFFFLPRNFDLRETRNIFLEHRRKNEIAALNLDVHHAQSCHQIVSSQMACHTVQKEVAMCHSQHPLPASSGLPCRRNFCWRCRLPWHVMFLPKVSLWWRKFRSTVDTQRLCIAAGRSRIRRSAAIAGHWNSVLTPHRRRIR